MPGHQAFLQDILEHPADDAPRLIYADWLEENGGPAGQERAEFIRVQCELSRLGPEDPRRCLLEMRERQLLARNRPAWDAVFVGVSLLAFPWVYRRGFPEVVAFRNLVDFLVAADNGLFERAPVTDLLVSEVEDGLEPLLESPYLARLSGLHLGSRLPLPAVTDPWYGGLAGVGEDDARALAKCPAVANLRTLAIHNHINRGSLGGAGIAALVRSPHLAGLVTLDLAGNAADDSVRAGRGLAAAKHLTRLRCLRLAHNRLTDDAFEALAEASCLANVEVLNLEGNFLGDAGARALAASPHLGRLRWLNVADQAEHHRGSGPLHPAGAAALRKAFGRRPGMVLVGLPPPRAPRKRPVAVEVALRNLGARVALAPADAPADGPGTFVCLNHPRQVQESIVRLAELPRLTHLALERATVRDTQGRSLPFAPGLARLPDVREVRLVGTYLTDELLQALPLLPGLRSLVVDNSADGYWPPANLGPLGELPQLRELYFQGHSVGDDQLPAVERFRRLEVLHLALTFENTDAGLARLGGLSELRELSLGGGGSFGDAGLAHLARLRRLEVLLLDAARLTSAGLSVLAGLHKLRILSLRYSERITDKGLAHLAGLTNLHTLVLRNTGITGRGLTHLRGLKQLGTLVLAGSPVSDVAVERLREALPALLIVR
jgi:uncharacterized protein (TIGR02996 family)